MATSQSPSPPHINLLVINDPKGRPHIAVDPSKALGRLSELPPNVNVIMAADDDALAEKAAAADAILLWKGSKAGLQRAFFAAGARLRWLHISMAGRYPPSLLI